MKIKGDKVKDNKPLLSGRLYRLDESRTVIFEERETGDVVNIIFTIGNHQYGIYGNEYKPPFIDDKGGKKADILVLVVDDKRRSFN